MRTPPSSLCPRVWQSALWAWFTSFILSMLLRMRTLAVAAGGLYVFLLVSVNSYPFEPKIALRSIAILMLMVIVSMVGYVSAQVHRDSILSLVTQTKPGELGVEFWLRMGTFVALPLLSLVISQFPSLNNALFSWLEPAANVEVTRHQSETIAIGLVDPQDIARSRLEKMGLSSGRDHAARRPTLLNPQKAFRRSLKP